VYLAWLVQRIVRFLNDRSWPAWRIIAGLALLTFVPFRLVWREVSPHVDGLRARIQRWRTAYQRDRDRVSHHLLRLLRRHRYFLYGEHVVRTILRHQRALRVGWQVALVSLIGWLIGSTVVGIRNWARTEGQAFISDGRDWFFRDIVPIPRHWLAWLEGLGPDFWHRFFPIAGGALLILLPALVILANRLQYRRYQCRLIRFFNLVQGLAVNPDNKAVMVDLQQMLSEQPDLLPFIHHHVFRGRDQRFSLWQGNWFANPNIVAGLAFLDVGEPEPVPILRELLNMLESRYQHQFRRELALMKREKKVIHLATVERIARLHESLDIIHLYLEMTNAAHEATFSYDEISTSISSMRSNYRRRAFVTGHILSAS